MEKSKRIKLPKTINIPVGIVLDEAPAKTERFGNHYEYIIPIGKDHVAYLTIDEDALMELKKLEPEITIY